MLERKKLKSRSHGVPESRSFLVRYRRTYVLKTYVLNKVLIIAQQVYVIGQWGLKGTLKWFVKECF